MTSLDQVFDDLRAECRRESLVEKFRSKHRNVAIAFLTGYSIAFSSGILVGGLTATAGFIVAVLMGRPC